MSSVIDERVVKMDFDNRSFERGASESLSTIEKLKNALQFKGASDNLDKVSRSMKEMPTGSLIDGIQSVRNKFSALEIVGVTALVNIANKAVNAGEALIKNLTIDQVSQGWSKYETNMGSVQTIMAGVTKEFENEADKMDYVSARLNKLIIYTDETSYKYEDMVNNIGKFVSSGIELEDAVTYMEGIASWAAISGVNATNASRAMTQLSQALGKGYVQLQDWSSIQTLNMDTVKFKQVVIDAAVSLKKLKKVGDGLYKTTKGNEVSVANFTGNLKDQWMTTEVLTAALDEYGRASNYLVGIVDKFGITTAELLGGLDDFNDGSRNITQIADDLGMSVSDVSKVFETLNSEMYATSLAAFRAGQETKTLTDAIDYVKTAVSSGWSTTFQTVFGDYLRAKSLWTDLAEVLYSVFVVGGENRNEFLANVMASASERLEAQLTQNGRSLDDLYEAAIIGGAKVGVNVERLTKDYKSFAEAIDDGVIPAAAIRYGLEELQQTAYRTGTGFNALRESVLGVYEADGKMDREEVLNFYGTFSDAVRRGAIDSKRLGAGLIEISQNSEEGRKFLEQFEKAIKDTGDVTDTYFKNVIGQSGSFVSAISTGAFSNETLRKALKSLDTQVTYSEAQFNRYKEVIEDVSKKQTKWAQDKALKEYAEQGYDAALMQKMLTDYTKNHELALEDYASELGEVTKLTEKQSLAFKALSEDKDLWSGADKASGFDRFGNSLRNLMRIVVVLAETFRDAKEELSTLTPQGVINGLRELQNRTDSVATFIEEKSEKITSIFKGLISIFHLVTRTIGRAFTTAVSWASKVIKLFANDAINAAGSVGDLLAQFEEWWSEHDFIVKAIDKIGSSIYDLAVKAKDFAKTHLPSFMVDGSIFGTIRNLAKGAADAITGMFNSIKQNGFFAFIKSLFSDILKIVEIIAPGIAGFVKGAFGGIKEYIQNVKGSDVAFATIIDGFVLAFVYGYKQLAKLVENVGGLAQSITDILWAVEEILENKVWAIRAESLVSVGKALMLIAGSFFILSMVPGDRILGLTFIIGALITMLMTSIKSIEKLNFAGLRTRVSGIFSSLFGPFQASASMMALSSTVKAIGVAILELAAALYVISKIPAERLIYSVGAIGALMAMLWAVSKFGGLSKLTTGGYTYKSVATGLVSFAAAVYILAKALSIVPIDDMDSMIKGLTIIAGLVAILAIGAGLAGLTDNVGKAGASILMISMALLVMSGVLKILAKIPLESIFKGIIAVFMLMFGLATFVGLVPSEKILSIGAGLLIISSALAILTLAFAALSFVPWPSIAKGLVAIVGGLGLMLLLLSKSAGSIVGATSILILSGALVVLTGTLIALSLVPFTSLVGGLLALVGGLLALTFVSAIMAPFAGYMFAGAAGIAAMSAASILAAGAIIALTAAARFLAGTIASVFSGVFGAISSIQSIKDAASEAKEAFFGASDELGYEGENWTKQYALGIQNGGEEAKAAAKTVVDSSLTTVEESKESANLAGATLGNETVAGFKDALSMNLGSGLTEAFAGAFNTSLTDTDSINALFGENMGGLSEIFNQSGALSIENFTEGLTGREANEMLTNAGLDLNNLSIPVGAQMDNGIAAGIDGNASTPLNSVGRLIARLVEKAQSEARIASPSRLFRDAVGRFIDLGIAKGIDDNTDSPIESMRNVIGEILDSANIDADPVIRPVLDLSQVQNEGRKLSDILNSNYSIGVAGQTSNSIDGSKLTANAESANSNNNKSITFIQNNNSPKALSRFDIYRQTRNQLNSMKELIRVQ